jgi:uncharacterized membrane protein
VPRCVIARPMNKGSNMKGLHLGVRSLLCGLQVEPVVGTVVFLAAVAANLFESYLGASTQGRVAWLTNDVVNVIQICLAAALALVGRLALFEFGILDV